jgi:hypothetical protein
LSRKGCPGIYSGVNTYIMVKLYKGKLSRNDNDEKKCGRNHSQNSSSRGRYIRTMFGYTTKLEGYTN